MQFVPIKEIGVVEWNNFCEISEDAWFRHTADWMNFRLGLNPFGVNLSFGVVDGGRLLSVVPIMKSLLEGGGRLFEFSMNGAPILYPAFANDLTQLRRKEMTKIIYERINEMACRENVGYASFVFEPLSGRAINRALDCSPFLWLDLSDVSLSINILELMPDEGSLFAKIRARYRSYIRSAERAGFSVEFFDKSTLTPRAFKIYEDIYFSAAGRRVGTEERWTETRKLIEMDHAVLILAKDVSGEYAAGVVFIKYKAAAYYGMGATAQKFRETDGLGHLMQWEIIKYLKRNDFSYYELGWNVHSVFSDIVYSPKDINISFFKRGFGAEVYPLYRGEKFYDAGYLKRKKVDLVKKFISYKYI